MKKKLGCIASGIAMLAIIGCGSDENNDNNSEPMELGPMVESQESFLFDIENGQQMGTADATLARHEGGATVSGTASNLDPGETYTVWWVFFNSPDFCVNAGDADALDAKCAADDLAGAQVALVGSSFGFCTGFIPDANGAATWSCERFIGQNGEGFELGDGLQNPEEAEVHMVIRTHGPTLTGEVGDSQSTTFNGGCEQGQTNAGLCKDIAYYMFPEPEAACVPIHGRMCPS